MINPKWLFFLNSWDHVFQVSCNTLSKFSHLLSRISFWSKPHFSGPIVLGRLSQSTNHLSSLSTYSMARTVLALSLTEGFDECRYNTCPFIFSTQILEVSFWFYNILCVFLLVLCFVSVSYYLLPNNIHLRRRDEGGKEEEREESEKWCSIFVVLVGFGFHLSLQIRLPRLSPLFPFIPSKSGLLFRRDQFFEATHSKISFQIELRKIDRSKRKYEGEARRGESSMINE